MTTNTSAQLTKAQDLYAEERAKRRKAEAKLLEIKARISMYSAIDREFAREIIEEIDEVVDNG